MSTTMPNDDLIALFERRVVLLKEVLELAQRQCHCAEQGKTGRLDRLIGRREHCLRQWGELEAALATALRNARGGTLSKDRQSRLLALIAESDALVENIGAEDRRINEAMETRNAEIAGKLDELRKGRTTLRAYSPKKSLRVKAVDRNA